MSKTLYLDCSSGISGDMAVAALLDLGADFDVLKKALDSLKIGGFGIKCGRVMKSGIDCMDFNVTLDEENQDHDMNYLYGHEHSHEGHEHSHEAHEHSHEAHEHSHDEHEHSHEAHEHSHEAHEHSHDEHEHSHEVHEHTHCHDSHTDDNSGNTHRHSHVHRGLNEIISIINSCETTREAKALAKKIFEIIARAEAKAHDKPVNEVHFHEVGAVDSIVDIISFAVCFDNLGVDKVIIPSLVEGCGTIRCAHGILPVPVPAVLNIVSENNLNIEFCNVKGELITPTGAAIAAAIITESDFKGRIKIERVGIGAGKRKYERPGMLRAMLVDVAKDEQIFKLETSIDDCTGENLGYVMELLFEAGARDVHYMPVYMKKNRPGWQLNVICDEKDVDLLEHIIFDNTTTIGIRKFRCDRTVLEREFAMIKTEYGLVKVKICSDSHGKRYYPEYDSLIKICKEKNISYQQAYAVAVAACCSK